MDFFFIGPQRTGTTWIYENLTQHSEICFPRGVKETMFFDRHFHKGLKWYRWHFTQCKPNQLKGEVAPTYFDDPEVPGRIKKLFPDCRIIISLRNPVERSRSLYQHHYQKGRISGSFSDALQEKPEILTSSYYAEHIPRWLNFFEESQILVISTGEIRNKPETILKKIAGFIGLDASEFEDKIITEVIYAAESPRSSSLAKLGSVITTFLHSRRLHFLVNIATMMGIKRLFFKELSKKPLLTDEERRFLERKLTPHINYIRDNFGELIIE